MRIITLKDIANELGVSTATVSYVYNDNWREKRIAPQLAARVKAKIKEMNYHPNALARQFRTKKTQTIGVVLGDLTRSISLDILCGIEKVLAQSDYLALVCNSNLGRLETGLLETLAARNVDGIILSPQGGAKSTELVQKLVSAGRSIVLIDNYLPSLDTDFVVSDNFHGAYQAAKFLVDSGYKSIAYLGSGKKMQALEDRFLGYTSALNDGGIPVSPRLICRQATNAKDIYPALEKIFGGGRPDAVFAETLLYFKDGFRFLFDNRLTIPDDIGLAGFDPLDMSLNELDEVHFQSIVKEPIPYISQLSMSLGEKAAQTLIDRLKGKLKKTFMHEFVKPDFV
jgi:LacI family transcriptional regulator